MPILFPTIASAPNNPKTAPDAPTDCPFIGARNADVREPVKSEIKKIINEFKIKELTK